MFKFLIILLLLCTQICNATEIQKFTNYNCSPQDKTLSINALNFPKNKDISTIKGDYNLYTELDEICIINKHKFETIIKFYKINTVQESLSYLSLIIDNKKIFIHIPYNNGNHYDINFVSLAYINNRLTLCGTTLSDKDICFDIPFDTISVLYYPITYNHIKTLATSNVNHAD